MKRVTCTAGHGYYDMPKDEAEAAGLEIVNEYDTESDVGKALERRRSEMPFYVPELYGYYKCTPDGWLEFVALAPVDHIDLGTDLGEILSISEEDRKKKDEPEHECTCEMEVIIRKGCQCGGR